MSKRISILTLILVFALLLCSVNLTVVDASYRYVSGALSSNSNVLGQSSSSAADADFDIPESIRAHTNDLLFGIRSQSKGRVFQRVGIKLLLLFILVFCFLTIAFRHFKSRLFLPENAIASSIILFFIHDKDGKK